MKDCNDKNNEGNIDPKEEEEEHGEEEDEKEEEEHKEEEDEEEDNENADKDNEEDEDCNDGSGKMGDIDGSTQLQLLAELMDSSLLEDECQPKLYRCDRVMGLNAGSKSDRELPPNVDYTKRKHCCLVRIFTTSIIILCAYLVFESKEMGLREAPSCLPYQ